MDYIINPKTKHRKFNLPDNIICKLVIEHCDTEIHSSQCGCMKYSYVSCRNRTTQPYMSYLTN